MATKKWSEKFKKAMVRKLEAGHSVAELSKTNGVHKSLLYAWKDKYTAAKPKEPVVKKAQKLGGITKEVIVYLEHAVAGIDADIRNGKIKKEKRYHALVKLALMTIMGD